MTLKAVRYHPDYCDQAKAEAQAFGRKPFSQWDTSHDLSVIDSRGVRYRVGQFKHAEWAYAVGKLIEEHGLAGLESEPTPFIKDTADG